MDIRRWFARFKTRQDAGAGKVVPLPPRRPADPQDELLEAQNRVARLQEELNRVQLRNARLQPWVALAMVLLILTWLLTR